MWNSKHWIEGATHAEDNCIDRPCRRPRRHVRPGIRRQRRVILLWNRGLRPHRPDAVADAFPAFVEPRQRKQRARESWGGLDSQARRHRPRSAPIAERSTRLRLRLPEYFATPRVITERARAVFEMIGHPGPYRKANVQGRFIGFRYWRRFPVRRSFRPTRHFLFLGKRRLGAGDSHPIADAKRAPMELRQSGEIRGGRQRRVAAPAWEGPVFLPPVRPINLPSHARSVGSLRSAQSRKDHDESHFARRLRRWIRRALRSRSRRTGQFNRL